MSKWNDTLTNLSFNASFMYSRGNIKKKGHAYDTPLDYVNSVMQEQYPGPYTVDEYFNSKNLMFQYRLVFSNPIEETFWMLQNS